MMFPFAEPVTVQVAGRVTDPYNEESTRLDWGNVTEREDVCGVADGGSVEPVEDARNAVDSDFDLIFDHDPGITSADRVVVRGLTCDVTGRPFLWRSPFSGWTPGCVVKVKVREG